MKKQKGEHMEDRGPEDNMGSFSKREIQLFPPGHR